MANTTSPLAVPLTTGAVRSFAQVRFEVAGLPLNGGILSGKRSRKRNREMVRSNNADPVGKTSGDNEYEGSVTVLYDWYTAMIQILINEFGKGYGDQQFRVYWDYVGTNLVGFGEVWDGCTFDSDVLDATQGLKPLSLEIDLKPLKIYFAVPSGANYLDYDDNADPLNGGNF